jgi:glutamate dehydrogenase/leucine dehydrogenase
MQDMSALVAAAEIVDGEYETRHSILLEHERKTLEEACRMLGIDDGTKERLALPDRVIHTSCPVRMEDGSARTFTGYRVQHNNALGPYIGGIRYHQAVDIDVITALAMLQSWQCSLVGLPFGGAKGGIAVEPAKLSVGELERLTRRYTSSMTLVFDPVKDIPCPDVNTGPREMAWIMDTWSCNYGYAAPGAATGKPTAIGGTQGGWEGAGRGVVIILEQWLKTRGRSLKDLRVAIEGFGRLGSVAASLMHAQGAKIVAATDPTGGARNEDGLDIPALVAYTRENGGVAGFAGGEPIDAKTLVTLPVDVLIPASTGRIITRSNASHIQAELVLEGANSPTTPTADEILHKRGVTLIPDILANAGGVILSYFEWVQGRSEFFWSADEVSRKLEELLIRAFNSVVREADERSVTYRQAAWCLGVGRVARAFEARGLYP